MHGAAGQIDPVPPEIGLSFPNGPKTKDEYDTPSNESMEIRSFWQGKTHS